MADNVSITPGAGAQVAADDIGGVLHQRVKISVGADGSATDLAPGQVAKTASLPVVLASDDDIQSKLGIVTETAPASDTASSGLNGRLQRIAQRITSLIALLPTALGQGTSAQSFRVVLPSDQIVAVGGTTYVLDVTLTTDTLIYADGDLLADTQSVGNAVRINNGTAVLQSVRVLDEDDQGVGMDLVFLSANNTMGTENIAPTITDTLARDILGIVSIGSADFIDLGGARVATKTGIGLGIIPASGTRAVYMAAITRGGTPTYTANGLKVRLTFLAD